MAYREIARILSLFILGFSALLLIPLFLALYYEFAVTAASHPQPHSAAAFLLTLLISLGLGGFCFWLGQNSKKNLLRKEGIVSIVLIWLFIPALAALPFYFSGTLKNPFQAYFEAASGFSTTGMTVIQGKAYNESGQEIPIQQTFGDPLEIHYSYHGNIPAIRNPTTGQATLTGIEAVGKALLFWRSFLQWVGGGAIIVVFVTIFPILGFSGKLLYQEATAAHKEGAIPLLTQFGVQLLLIYIGLTVLHMIALLVTNPLMEWLDAITISFSTLSTGGFSIRNANIGYYKNAWTEWIVILFMILGSMNFSIYYHAIARKFFRIYRPEFLLYLVAIILSCLLAVFYLYGSNKLLLTGEKGIFSIEEAVRYGVFQIVSAITTTGFATAQYDVWPYAVQALMLILMFVGGMSGSPAGGIKIIRNYMLFRVVQTKVESLFRMNTIRQVKIEDQVVDNETSTAVLCFFLLFIFFAVFGTYVYILQNIDPQSAMSLAACMLNNSALGFRIAHPGLSCAFLSDSGLVISSILMLLGRLEFFVVLALLIPSFWRYRG